MIARLRRSELVQHGAVVFAGLMLANVLNYVFYMLAGRILGVESYGELTSLTAAVLTLSAPAVVAQIVFARLASGFAAAGDRAALDHLVRAATNGTAAVGAVVALAGIAFRAPLGAFFHVGPGFAVVAAITLGAFAVVTVQRGVLQGSHRFSDLAISYCIEGLVRLAAGIALAKAYGALGGLSGWSIGVACAFAYGLWLDRAAFRAQKGVFPFGGAHVFGIAWRIAAAQLMLTVLSFYDVALVRHLFDSRSAGLYSAASLVGRAVMAIIAFVPMVIMPKATARSSAGASVLPLLAAGVGVAAVLGSVVAVAAAAAPGGLAAAFAGNAFRDAAPIVFPYVLAAVMLGLASVVAAFEIGLHRYAFVGPTLAVAIAEIAVIALWHPSIAAVVRVLLAGHTAVFAATCVGLGGTVRPDEALEARRIATR